MPFDFIFWYSQNWVPDVCLNNTTTPNLKRNSQKTMIKINNKTLIGTFNHHVPSHLIVLKSIVCASVILAICGLCASVSMCQHRVRYM